MHASGCRPAPVGDGPRNAIAPESGRRPVDAIDAGVAAGADHPWRHAVENYYAARQLAADRRAWAAVQP